MAVMMIPFVLLLLLLVDCNGFVANSGVSMRGSRLASCLSMAVKGKLLVVQNKGGGHGTIGSVDYLLPYLSYA